MMPPPQFTSHTLRAPGGDQAWQVGQIDAIRVDQDEVADTETTKKLCELGADTAEADDADLRVREDSLTDLTEQPDLTIVYARCRALRHRERRRPQHRPPLPNNRGLGEPNQRLSRQPDVARYG